MSKRLMVGACTLAALAVVVMHSGVGLSRSGRCISFAWFGVVRHGLIVSGIGGHGAGCRGLSGGG